MRVAGFHARAAGVHGMNIYEIWPLDWLAALEAQASELVQIPAALTAPTGRRRNAHGHGAGDGTFDGKPLHLHRHVHRIRLRKGGALHAPQPPRAHARGVEAMPPDNTASEQYGGISKTFFLYLMFVYVFQIRFTRRPPAQGGETISCAIHHQARTRL